MTNNLLRIQTKGAEWGARSLKRKSHESRKSRESIKRKFHTPLLLERGLVVTMIRPPERLPPRFAVGVRRLAKQFEANRYKEIPLQIEL